MTDATPFADKPFNWPFQVGVELEGFTLLCYRLPASRLRGLVPTSLPLVTWEEQGTPMTWLTVFIGRNVLRGMGPLPAPPLSFYQLNYRAYVMAPERSLFIFRSVVDQPLVAAGSRMAIDFPAVYEPFAVSREGFDRPGATESLVIGVGGRELTLGLERLDALPPVAGFASPEAAVDYLGNVPDAYYSLNGKRVRRLVSPHPPLAPYAARATRLELGWLMREAVLSRPEAERPVAIYLQDKAPFPVCV